MLDAIEKYHNSRNWREGYRKNPATWLNEECWTDEYDEEREVRKTAELRGNSQENTGQPRTLYTLSPRFAGNGGESGDGNAGTTGDEEDI